MVSNQMLTWADRRDELNNIKWRQTYKPKIYRK